MKLRRKARLEVSHTLAVVVTCELVGHPSQVVLRVHHRCGVPIGWRKHDQHRRYCVSFSFSLHVLKALKVLHQAAIVLLESVLQQFFLCVPEGLGMSTFAE